MNRGRLKSHCGVTVAIPDSVHVVEHRVRIGEPHGDRLGRGSEVVPVQGPPRGLISVSERHGPECGLGAAGIEAEEPPQRGRRCPDQPS